MAKKKRLGKGLNALLDLEVSGDEIINMDINDIEPDLEQPRKSFNEDKLKDLAESIKKHGIIQPIIVKKEDNCYRIVAGERRWRAAKMINLTEIPVIVKDLNKKEVREIALIENLQREDLNIIEEALAFKELINKYSLTQGELSKILGKSRVVITNTIRLLKLTDVAKEALIQKRITEGHARLLITIDNPKKQKEILVAIIEKKMTVRELEKYINKNDKKIKKDNEKKEQEKDLDIKKIEEKMQNKLKTKVNIKNNKNNKGSISIEYYSRDELLKIANFFK